MTAPSDIDPSLVGALEGDSVPFPDSGNGGYTTTLVDLTLVLSDDLGAFEGVASTSVNATRDRQRFALDARELDVSAVTVNGEPIEAASTDDELIMTLDTPL